MPRLNQYTIDQLRAKAQKARDFALRCEDEADRKEAQIHELATDLDSINYLDGNMMVASLITGIHEGRRSFKVYIAPPEGISYAKDIAEKYGVTYEQLERSIVH